MEQATLNSKIRVIISSYRLSDRQFAIKIGVTQSVIGSMFQKGTEPSSKVIRNTLNAFPEISADWFLRDKGEMLMSPNKEMERISKLINTNINTISTLQDTINANIVERLQKILTYSNLSVRALAIKCSLKQQTLDKHIKGISEPSSNTLIGIAAAFPEISSEWLLLGKGTMLKENMETERINKLIDTITTLQDTINAKNETIAILNERIKQLEK